MQFLATAAQMREIDRTAIEHHGIPGLVLMENAGRAFVEVLSIRHPFSPDTRVSIFTGKGNNAGDGFVIARHLLNRGCRVDVFMTSPGEALKGDARTNWESLTKVSSDRLHIEAINDVSALAQYRPAEIIVDALFGTGFTGALTGVHAQLAPWVNHAGAFVASVDIPSGVDATTGQVAGEAICARLTVTMGLAKPGQYVGAGREHSGEVVVADIGFPPASMSPGPEAVYRIFHEDVAAWLPHRSWNANKYSVGKVYIVAGSRTFTGAPCMAAEAALRGGAGAVVLGIPESIHPILAAKLTEVILQPLPETAEGTIAPAARDKINERCRWADAVVVGPGIGRNEATDGFLRDLVATLDRPLVLDADGLNAFAGHTEILAGRPAGTVLTPHAGELSRLTGQPAGSIEEERVGAARAAGKRFRSTVVLKGAPTATAWRDGCIVLNTTGNPGMATIGSGDVLTGLAASLIAQGMDEDRAAAASVFIHGRAGDLARERLGIRSMLASDIMRALPEAFLSIEGA